MLAPDSIRPNSRGNKIKFNIEHNQRGHQFNPTRVNSNISHGETEDYGKGVQLQQQGRGEHSAMEEESPLHLPQHVIPHRCHHTNHRGHLQQSSGVGSSTSSSRPAGAGTPVQSDEIKIESQASQHLVHPRSQDGDLKGLGSGEHQRPESGPVGGDERHRLHTPRHSPRCAGETHHQKHGHSHRRLSGQDQLWNIYHMRVT